MSNPQTTLKIPTTPRAHVITNVDGTTVYGTDPSNPLFTTNGGASGNPAAGPTGSSVPADASYTGVDVAGNLEGVSGRTLTNAQPMDVSIVDGSGNQITNFSGGGTQYADGTIQTTPTGTVALGKNPSNVLHSVALDASGNLNVDLQTAIPAGTNQIGHVVTDSGSTTVVTGNVTVVQPSGASLHVDVDNFPATQPVSGTVTANQGTPNSAANSWPVEVTDGTNVLGTSGHPLRVDPTGTTNQPVTQATSPWTIQGDSASGVAKAGNPVQTGGVFNTTQPTVTTGQTVENQSTSRGAQIVATGADTFNVTVSTALPAGANVIGHVITDSGSVSAVTQSTSPWVDNITQVASTVLGTPQTFGSAPTGVVIGTSSDVYVAGTRARSNQTTTAAGVVDVNVVGSLGVTNSVTNGTFAKLTDNTTGVNVIAATNALKTDLSSVAGTATSTATSGVQKVGVVGNAGAIFDGATAASVPANAVQQGLRAATAYPTAVTDGQLVGGMADKAGRTIAVLSAPRDLIQTLILSNNSSASATNFGSAGGTGVFLDIAWFVFTNRSSTASVVSLTDGTNTWTFAIAANGGLSFCPPVPVKAATSATQWQVSNSAGVAFDYMAEAIQNK